MIGMIDEFYEYGLEHDIELIPTAVTQTLSEEELLTLIPEYDGWIIGDDPVTREVLARGKAGNLKAAVRWGIGVDNVDFAACQDLNIPVSNTPNMFGKEVADIALAYVIGLARHLFEIHSDIRLHHKYLCIKNSIEYQDALYMPSKGIGNHHVGRTA